MNLLLFARVRNDFVWVACNFHARAMALAYKDDLKTSRLQHAGKLALPGADGELVARVIPVKVDRGIDTLFVVVIVVLVLVQGEAAVGAGIDAQLDGVGGLFIGVLNEWAHRHDRAGPDHERHLLDGSVGNNCLAAVQLFARPEIEPGSAGGEIYAAFFFFWL